ncbi:hypothetical protein ACTFIW_000046 [Dictyostelium discoideum]
MWFFISFEINLLLKARFLLHRVYGSKTWNDSTSSSSRFKKVKPLRQHPIIQSSRVTKEEVFNGILLQFSQIHMDLFDNKNNRTPPRFESMEVVSCLPTAHSFAFYPENINSSSSTKVNIKLVFPIWK